MNLTNSQKRVLAFVSDYIQRVGVPPTRKEISEGLGFASGTAAEDHLKALARKGVIQLIPNIARGIKILAL